MRKALELCDEYVRVYTDQKPQWWGPDGKPVNIPAADIEALREARTGQTAD